MRNNIPKRETIQTKTSGICTVATTIMRCSIVKLSCDGSRRATDCPQYIHGVYME